MEDIAIINSLVLLILLFYMISGYRHGFVLKVVHILSFFLLGFLIWQLSGMISGYIALYPKESVPLAGTIAQDLLYDTFNRILIFVVLFVLCQLLLFCIRPTLRIFNHIPVVSTLNRFAGCILGGLEGLFVLVLVALVLQLPFWEKGNQIVKESYLRYYKPIANVALFYTKEPIAQIQSLQDALQDKESFTTEDVARLKAWMLQQDIDKESVEDIINHLRVESYERKN